MSNAISEIKRFQFNRGLNFQNFDSLNEHTNIVEELLESIGFDVPKENRSKLAESVKEFVNKLFIDDVVKESNTNHDVYEKVDAYADIVVFAVGALIKLGYEPEEVLLETCKEIHSREGEMIDGKFIKFDTPEAKAKWHKADYSRCKY